MYRKGCTYYRNIDKNLTFKALDVVIFIVTRFINIFKVSKPTNISLKKSTTEFFTQNYFK